MILYNITINVDSSAHDEWMLWMRSTFIPEMLKTGIFSENKILKLLNEVENNPGVTYSFQFFTWDIESLEIFQKDYEVKILNELYRKFRDRFVEFRTMLEIIE